MDRRVRRFRQEVERLGLGRVGGRYPAWLRAEAVAMTWARPELPRRQVAQELGVAVASLERWVAQAPEPEPTFLPVEVEDAQRGEVGAGWVVVTPRGYRVEGRDTATLLRLLAELS